MAGAKSAAGVKWAAPNALLVTAGPVVGKTCSPMWDPAYRSDDNYVPYQMIGMMEAVAILKASHAALGPVHVGVSDTPVYTGSGQGLATELHFPGAGGDYPDGEVRVRGLGAGSTTDVPDPDAEGGLSHGTGVTHIISADWGDGVTGVAAALGDRLTVTCSSSLGDPVELSHGYTYPQLAGTGLDTYASGALGTAFVELIQQVEDGAKVINLSWTTKEVPGVSSRVDALVFGDFLVKMNEAYDDVLFVAAAGNEGEALTGENLAPGGMWGLPNLMTVGALDRTGDRADILDWSTQEEREAAYRQKRAAGEIAAGTSFEEWEQSFAGIGGSNYAGDDGEVTISACGTGILLGRDANGNPIAQDGTSFAAPQVAAAAALLKSLDPTLTAGQIKDLLVETGDTEVTISGSRVTVPENMGGRVLRVDKAVLEVINRLRGPANELIHGDLIDLMTIELTAEEHEFGYLVTASTPRMETPEGIDFRITVEGEAEIFGEETHRIYNALESGSWTVAPGPDPVTVRVHRLDNGACAFLEFPGTGMFASTTTTEVTATTGKSDGERWVLTGAPVVNPEGLRLEYYGGGAQPDWFGEPRFQGKWVKYRPSATSFAVDDRWVDHEFESYNVTIECAFDSPPPVLVPGETYELTVDFSHSGSVVDGNPGQIFQYFTEGASLNPKNEGLSYSPWSPDPAYHVATKTWELTVSEGRSGDTIEIRAGLWNAAQCTVVWTYTAE